MLKKSPRQVRPPLLQNVPSLSVHRSSSYVTIYKPGLSEKSIGEAFADSSTTFSHFLVFKRRTTAAYNLSISSTLLRYLCSNEDDIHAIVPKSERTLDRTVETRVQRPLLHAELHHLDVFLCLPRPSPLPSLSLPQTARPLFINQSRRYLTWSLG